MLKFDDKQKAVDRAKADSNKDSQVYYVILSKGLYYVDTNDFIRSWETLICSFQNGKLI